MKEYCENSLCQNKCIKEVPVSVIKPSDQTRSLCAACEESYTWGVQHARMTCQGLKIDPPPEEKGDQCDYEDVQGNPIEPPEYEYQPYIMVLRARTPNEAIQAAMLTRAYEIIEKVLESLDVGGEQSRQLAEEIKILKDFISHRESAKASNENSGDE